MSERLHRWIGRRRGGLFTAAVIACALAGNVAAAEHGTHGELLEGHSALHPAPILAPFPLAVEPGVETLGLDRPERDAPALRLQLTEPLALETMMLGGNAAPGGGFALAASSLNYQLDDQLALSAGVALQQGGAFTPVASIHCEGGTLAFGSYRASNCHVVDDANYLGSETLSLGASYAPTDNMRGTVRLFRAQSEQFQGLQPGMDLQAAPLLDPLGLSLPGRRGYVPAAALATGARALDYEQTGIDLEFQLGVSMDQAGDLVFGLQLTRILDSDATGAYYQLPGYQQWTIAQPYDSARLSIDWSKGAFSGGVSSYYRSPVEFMNRGGLDRNANFDVHFTWRAPWNASLSVGASNLLGGGDEPATEAPMADPFESIYGRIPYVRYKQDL